MKYAVFDLETTGFSSERDSITEFGWMVVCDGVPQAPRSVLVHGLEVPEKVAALTGITTAMLAAQGVPLGEALLAFLLDTEDLPLVGHNAVRFDVPFLEAACRRCQVVAPGRHLYRDTAAMYKARKLRRPAPSGPQSFDSACGMLNAYAGGMKFNLAHCATDLGVHTDDATAHRASGDVIVTQRIYEALCRA